METDFFQKKLLIEIEKQGVDFIYFVDISHLTVTQIELAPCKSMRWGFLKAYAINETSLSYPMSNQSHEERVSHPPQASFA